MTEHSPDLRKVTMNVDPGLLPELMENLSSFAMRHSISIEVCGTELTEASSDIELPAYNPAIVTWANDSLGQKIPIITEKGVKTVVNLTFGELSASRRLILALSRAASPTSKWGTADYMLGPNEFGLKAIRADRIEMLIKGIKSGEINARGVGEKSEKLLEDIAKSLLLTDTSEITTN